MFEKFADITKLKKMQEAVREERVEGEASGVRVVLDGSFRVLEVDIPEGMEASRAATAVKEAFNAAAENVQRQLVQRLGSFM